MHQVNASKWILNALNECMHQMNKCIKNECINECIKNQLSLKIWPFAHGKYTE